MNKFIRKPAGTEDLFPEQASLWRMVENELVCISQKFAFCEIRVPSIEYSKLFVRSVGDATDIVEKEMYIFNKEKEDSIALRPEFTAGIVRAYLENNIYKQGEYRKYFTIGALFRHEKPQKGRLRQYHSYNIELIGSKSPFADVETIMLGINILKFFNVKYKLLLNSCGCPNCRPNFRTTLKSYANNNVNKLCNTCKDRVNRNVLRLLDCKNPNCKDVMKNAPSLPSFLCDDCNAHFNTVQSVLSENSVQYVLTPTLIRGLDYYTNTVYEFVSEKGLGSQNTIIGGGRYDGLAKELGGPEIPAVGFGLGLERLVLLLHDTYSPSYTDVSHKSIFVSYQNTQFVNYAYKLALKLRDLGLSTEFGNEDKSLKAQLRFANKMNFDYTAIIGENEVKENAVTIKSMKDGIESKININDLPTFIEGL